MFPVSPTSSNMKKLSLIFSLLLIVSVVKAQFSIQAGYLDMGPNDWEEKTVEDFHRSGYVVGLEYWFRLKNYRVEFFPGIWYNQRQDQTVLVSGIPDLGDYEYSANYLSLQLATTFYPLDFEGDCNCPTFSKQGNLIKKGFFLQVVPEFGIFNKTINTSTIAGPVETKEGSGFFAIGAGAGLDIGITDLITISPMVRLTYFPSLAWGEGSSPNGTLENTAFLGRQFSLRISFRPDYLKQTGRFRRR